MSDPEKCRSCGGKLLAGGKEHNRWYPFCSERCRWVDLGRWFNGEYRLTDREQADEEPDAGKSGAKGEESGEE